MADFAIRVEGLGKRYRIGAPAMNYRTLRESVSGMIHSPTSWLRGMGTDGGLNTIWALKDVTFEVKVGQVLGVIGRNGAGKSTLLKILSRVTDPTEGLGEIHGRVGSLLEVGTGFHPELTGRENIFLNGAILGMHRVEIDRKFDEIVDFSETDYFQYDGLAMNIREYYSKLVGWIGTQGEEAENSASSQAVLVQQIETNKESLSSVSMDEELANLLKYQHAYNASARIMSIIDGMLEKLIEETGLVGR